MRQTVYRESGFDGAVALLEMPPQLCEIGTPGALFEDSLQRTLGRAQENLIRGLVSVMDKILLETLSAQSVTEFKTIRAKQWPKYIRAVRALSDTLGNFMSKDARDVVAKEALSALEADLEKQEDRFGDVLTEQGIFTLYTIGRVRSLAKDIAIRPLSRENRAADSSLLSEYSATLYWSGFHLDLMIAAIKFERPIASELRPEMCEGLRAAVNAFTIAKEALLLRSPRIEEAPVAELPWDDEDEELLALSMRDFDANSFNNTYTAG
jgi:hypothetical protein